jgi:hypothetical protein
MCWLLFSQSPLILLFHQKEEKNISIASCVLTQWPCMFVARHVQGGFGIDSRIKQLRPVTHLSLPLISCPLPLCHRPAKFGFSRPILRPASVQCFHRRRHCLSSPHLSFPPWPYLRHELGMAKLWPYYFRVAQHRRPLFRAARRRQGDAHSDSIWSSEHDFTHINFELQMSRFLTEKRRHVSLVSKVYTFRTLTPHIWLNNRNDLAIIFLNGFQFLNFHG